jgi:hypothetical protein
MGGQSFSIPLAAGSDQKGSDIPEILKIAGPNTSHLTSETLMKSRNYVYFKKLK